VVDIATRAMLGEKLRDMGYGVGLYRQSVFSAVKVPVFSFEKLADVDTHLGPEMKSTGEVLGIGRVGQRRERGGSMIALTDRPEEVSKAIRSRGGMPFIVKTGVDGVRIEKE
jgi:hypothetical protein